MEETDAKRFRDGLMIMINVNKKPTNWWGRQSAAPLKFVPNRQRRNLRSFVSNFDKCRREVAGDIISGEAEY